MLLFNEVLATVLRLLACGFAILMAFAFVVDVLGIRRDKQQDKRKLAEARKATTTKQSS